MDARRLFREFSRPYSVVLTLAGLGVGCASTTGNYMFLTGDRWNQEMIRHGIDVKVVPNPLAVNADMRATAKKIVGPGSARERLGRLQSALFDTSSFPFQYDHQESLTAIEAFARREGNCLSFTNLFVAMGRSLDLPVTTALVRHVQVSERDGDLIMVNNHVVAALQDGTSWLYYDFDQRDDGKLTQIQPLDDLWITALYLNNRGADELRAGRPDIALRLFDYATKLAPAFAPTWSNMGVARRRLGDTQGALDAYSHALTVSAADSTVLANLASLYRSLGREQEARAVMREIQIGNATPSALILRGDLARTMGHTGSAIRLYKRACHLGPALADPWVALARVELTRSRPDRARKDLGRALKLEPRNEDAIDLLHQLAATPQPGINP